MLTWAFGNSLGVEREQMAKVRSPEAACKAGGKVRGKVRSKAAFVGCVRWEPAKPTA